MKYKFLAIFVGLFVFSCSAFGVAPGTWTQAGSMHTTRILHIATLLQNGKNISNRGGDSVRC